MTYKYNLQLSKFFTVVLTFLLAIPMINLAYAQASGSKDTTDIFRNVKFRNIGPAIAGGRVSSVQGVPGKPNTYYIGAGGGGVWKTTDGGVSWKDVFKNEPTSSIGAIAIAPSNPNLVWVGTGEANIRNDVVNGHGVYYSPDAGATWKFMGLKDAGQISKIIVNPVNPKEVFVAAIGHAWGPNSERGLFKTTDGGKTWQKVLFVNDSTGVTDVIYKPENPQVMFAATWKVMRRPWTLIDGGKSSAMYRSDDGGDTWTKVTDGLPNGNIGRIAFATSKSNPDHIYALIAAKNGTLWDTHDGGTHWKMVSNNHQLNVRPFYFSTMAVDPTNDNHVFFLSYQMSESTDGGKTAKSIAPDVHVDYHAIWIDPDNPERMIVGNDGGVYISQTGGKQWHYCDNMPIEQFYEVAVNSANPFSLGGGLQDNNAWYGPSYNLHGRSIKGHHWITVAGGDGEYVVPAPSDPDIVYAESQNGFLSRTNLKTGMRKYIRPTFKGVEMMSPSKLKYRYNWTTPIAVSYTDANTVYIGANVLFKTTDGGKTWNPISPDLTRNNKSTQVIAGGPVAHDISGAETYGTILSVGLSKQDPNVIWVGTDDGQIQVTRDGGKTWDNVSNKVPHLSEGGRIYQVGVSPFNPGTCYITVDYHMMDNNHPYVFKTDNFGHSWKAIDSGLPEDYPAHVVREDPNHKGFLVLGTDNALYYSNNDGDSWNKIKSNFPTSPVYDLKFVKRDHDLVVATHGRGLFIADDIRPLEEIDHKVEDSSFHLFSIQPAIMYHRSNFDGSDEPGHYSAPNPPSGALIDYYLKHSLKPSKKEKKAHETPVKIVIKDSNGKIVNTLYGPAKPGVNRFAWNLSYKGPDRLNLYGTQHKSPNNTRGINVLPGTYTVSVSADGKTQTQSLVVKADPNLPFNMEGARQRNEVLSHAMDDISTLNDMLNDIHSLHTQIGNLKKTVNQQPDSNQYKSVEKQASTLDKKLMDLKDTLIETKAQHGVGEDDIHYLSHFYSWFRSSGYRLYSYDEAPSASALAYFHQLEGQLKGYISQFNNIVDTDVSSFNQAATTKHLPTLLPGKHIQL